MMEFDEIVVKESPGLCRCCLSEGCYKDLSSEYSWMSETEIYADMLLECFDISISQHPTGPNGANRLICEVCITRLRDACNFKKQVLESEKKFVDMIGRGEFRPKVLLYQTQMKTEVVMDVDEETGAEGEAEYLDDDADYVDEALLKTEEYGEPSVSEDITVSALAVKGKRGRPRKTTKPEKKAKVAKPDEKPTKSKAVSKDVDGQNDQQCRRKQDLTELLTIIIRISTAIPFKWHSNNYMCFYCSCPFDDCEKLKQHTKEEHEGAKPNTVLQSISKTRSIKLDVSDLSCKKCDSPMKNIEQFLQHVSEAHSMTFNKEAADVLYSFVLADMKMSCLECGLVFQFFGPLLIHTYKNHSKSKPFLCELCGASFIAQKNVSSHKKAVHADACQMKCKECGEGFRTQYKLTSHMQKVHQLGLMKCPKCPEVLGSRCTRKDHLAIVHDVKSFQCDECPKVFSLQNKLLKHKRRVHLKEKNFTCQICGFEVFSKELLNRHMVKHDDSRPFECDLCEKTFQRKRTLDYHRRIHTNDKRYVCIECGQAFVQSTSLKIHMKAHHRKVPD